MGSVICHWSGPFELVLLPIGVVCNYMCITLCVIWGKHIYDPFNTGIACESRSTKHGKTTMVFSLLLSPQFWRI